MIKLINIHIPALVYGLGAQIRKKKLPVILRKETDSDYDISLFESKPARCAGKRVKSSGVVCLRMKFVCNLTNATIEILSKTWTDP